MKTRTKIGRKVIGSLISASLVFSILPAMLASAADEPIEYVKVDARPTSQLDAPGSATVNPGSATVNGIKVAVAGERSNIGAQWGIGVGDTTAGGTYTFSIDESGDYAGYVITKIEINVTSVSSCAMAEGNVGWGTLAAGSLLTWTGAATNSVSLNMVATSGRYHTVGYDAITVYVQRPVDALAVKDSDGATAGNTLVGDTVQLSAVITPTNTTFDKTVEWSTNGASETAIQVDNDGLVHPYVAGEYVITASLKYHPEITANYALTVYNPDEPVVTVDPSSLELTLDSDPVTLSYSIIDQGHDIEFVGFFIDEEGEDIIEVDMETGAVTPIGLGTATVYVGIWDYTLDDWFEGTCTVSVVEAESEDDSEEATEPEVPFYTEEQLRAMSVQNFVEGMYLTVLNRQFDAQGRDSWLNLILEQNGTATAVAIGFLESPEFISKNLSNEEFIATCYRVFCNRAATADETAQWVAQLEAGATRDSVIREFAQSPEWASICAFFKVNV